MRQILLFCAALFMLAAVCRAGQGPEPTETIVRLTVQPAPEPKPALFYQLLPELRDMDPGNPVLGYLKCFMDRQTFWFDKEMAENREKWLQMPLKDLPLEQLVKLGYGKGGLPLRYADEAAKLEQPDWQVLLPLRREGINLLVSEVQQMRLLSEALRLRCRLELAEKRYGDAIGTFKTLFALARSHGEHPTLVGGLVGSAIASNTLETLDEFIAQPGAPNLYWALTDLPNPLVGWRKGMQGERMWLGSAFEGIPARAALTEWQSKRLVQLAQRLCDMSGGEKEPRRDVEAWLAERGKNTVHLAAARKRLIETGFPPGKHLDELPALQVILVDEVVAFEIKRDHQLKLMMLPYWQMEALSSAKAAANKGPDDSLFGGLLKSFLKVRRAHARLEQRIALLRCVEGLRLYAAAHQGQLPATLADVPVPLPVDPITGKAFAYSLQSGTATVRGTPPAEMEKIANYNVRYEIKIAK
jgi:hypothetical protein